MMMTPGRSNIRRRGKYTLVADRDGNVFKRNNLDPDAPLEPTGQRRYPIKGTLNLGIKEFKRQNRKNRKGKVNGMYKKHGWAEVEKGIQNHLEHEQKKAAEKPIVS